MTSARQLLEAALYRLPAANVHEDFVDDLLATPEGAELMRRAERGMVCESEADWNLTPPHPPTTDSECKFCAGSVALGIYPPPEPCREPQCRNVGMFGSQHGPDHDLLPPPEPARIDRWGEDGPCGYTYPDRGTPCLIVRHKHPNVVAIGHRWKPIPETNKTGKNIVTESE